MITDGDVLESELLDIYLVTVFDVNNIIGHHDAQFISQYWNYL